MDTQSTILFNVRNLRRAAVVLGLLFATLASAVTELRTAAQQASEPKFVTVVDNGRAVVGGLCVDIMRAIESTDPGLKFTGDQVWQPLVRMEAGMGNGDLDVVCGLLRTGAREARYTYLDTALFSVTYYLIARADDEVQIQSWDDVRNLGDHGIVLVINGFGILGKLETVPGLKIDAGAYTSKGNFDKLLAGRGRFYYHRSPGINAEIRNAGVEEKVRILPTAMHREKFYMVGSRKLPADTLNRLGKAIAQLERNGELAKLFKQWDR